MQSNDTCISIFKGGDINREGYTAIWASLINSWVRDQHVPTRKGL